MSNSATLESNARYWSGQPSNRFDAGAHRRTAPLAMHQRDRKALELRQARLRRIRP